MFVTRMQSAVPVQSTARARLERALLIVGVAALGFNMRGAITSLPPIFPELEQRLRLSAAAVSVLAATPVLCFAVVSGLAAALARWLGEERVLLAAIALLAGGLAARGAAPAALLFPGTVCAGAAIAVMNVLLASLIKRRWPERAGFLIGLYITTMSAGAIAGSLVAVPLWQATSGSVALSLGWLAAPAVLGILIWAPQLSSGGATPRTPRRRAWWLPPRYRARTASPPGDATPRTPRCAPDGSAIVSGARPSGGATPRTPGPRARWLPPRYRARTGSPPGEATPRTPGPTAPRAQDPAERAAVRVHRHALAWQVAAFMGLQSLLYYAVLSWLPTILRARGESAAGAGDLLAVMGAGNLAVSLIVPVVAQRMRSQRMLVVPTVAAVAGGLAGLAYAPLGSAVAWALILGAGQNAALGLAIFFTTARTPNAATAASLSALAQAGGYLLASTGPLAVGLLHSVTGGWTVPLGMLFALTVFLLTAGLLAARPRVLPSVRSRT